MFIDNPAIFMRPVAFRPCLATGLTLSFSAVITAAKYSLKLLHYINQQHFLNNFKQLMVMIIIWQVNVDSLLHSFSRGKVQMSCQNLDSVKDIYQFKCPLDTWTI